MGRPRCAASARASFGRCWNSAGRRRSGCSRRWTRSRSDRPSTGRDRSPRRSGSTLPASSRSAGTINSRFARLVGAPLLDDETFLRPVLATFAFALVPPYRDVDAAAGTTVQLSIDGQSGGDWTLVRDETGGTCARGGPTHRTPRSRWPRTRPGGCTSGCSPGPRRRPRRQSRATGGWRVTCSGRCPGLVIAPAGDVGGTSAHPGPESSSRARCIGCPPTCGVAAGTFRIAIG